MFLNEDTISVPPFQPPFVYLSLVRGRLSEARKGSITTVLLLNTRLIEFQCRHRHKFQLFIDLVEQDLSPVFDSKTPVVIFLNHLHISH